MSLETIINDLSGISDRMYASLLATPEIRKQLRDIENQLRDLQMRKPVVEVHNSVSGRYNPENLPDPMTQKLLSLEEQILGLIELVYPGNAELVFASLSIGQIMGDVTNCIKGLRNKLAQIANIAARRV